MFRETEDPVVRESIFTLVPLPERLTLEVVHVVEADGDGLFGGPWHLRALAVHHWNELERTTRRFQRIQENVVELLLADHLVGGDGLALFAQGHGIRDFSAILVQNCRDLHEGRCVRRVGTVEDARADRLVVGVDGLLDRLVRGVVRRGGGRRSDWRIARRCRVLAVLALLAVFALGAVRLGATRLRGVTRTRVARRGVARVRAAARVLGRCLAGVTLATGILSRGLAAALAALRRVGRLLAAALAPRSLRRRLAFATLATCILDGRLAGVALATGILSGGLTAALATLSRGGRLLAAALAARSLRRRLAFATLATCILRKRLAVAGLATLSFAGGGTTFIGAAPFIAVRA